MEVDEFFLAAHNNASVLVLCCADISVHTLGGHSVLGTLIRCDFSPMHSTGQRFVYSGSADGSIFIWDILLGRVVEKLRGHLDCVRDVSWHPYEPVLVSSSWDCTIKVWTYVDAVRD